MRAREKRLALLLSELVLLVVGVYVSIFEFHLRLRRLWGLDVIVGALALAIVLMIYDRFRLLPQMYEETEGMRDAATREESTAVGVLRKMILLTSAVLVIGVVVFVYVWANTFE
jgi:multisubunit Na+/H+ antiporter MnhC subunit